MLAFNKITCKNIGKYLEQKNLKPTYLFIPPTCPIDSSAFKMVPQRWGIIYRQRSLITTDISRKPHDVSSGERRPLTVQCTLYIGNFRT
jgi:hypothetical protein